jgi:transcription elongation factor Elf1
MGVTAGIFLASILIKEMRYLVYIRYLCLQYTVTTLAVYKETYIHYTAKNAEPAAQHDWTMFCCPRCSHLSTILNNIVEPKSGVTILFNIVDNCKQCGQQSIFQSCFHQYCNNLRVFNLRVEASGPIYKHNISIQVRHVFSFKNRK